MVAGTLREGVAVAAKLGPLADTVGRRVVELVGGSLGIVEGLDLKPVDVARRASASSQVAEGPERSPRVIENTVEDDLDLPPMAFLDEPKEEAIGRRPFPARGIGRVLRGPDQAIAVGIGPEVVVHVVECGGVSPARGRGLEDGVQDDGGDAQALDVVEPL